MRKILSLILALVMLLSFSVVALAGNGDGTGGGDGSGGGDDEWDGIPAELTFYVDKVEYTSGSVNIHYIMETTAGGLKHVANDNLSETLNTSTVVLTDSLGNVVSYSPTFANAGGSISSQASFDMCIDRSLLVVDNTYTLTIKAGATWANKPKNTTTLESDYSYSFLVKASEEETITEETTTSKQKSPLVTEATTEETTTLVEETTTEITTVATTEAVTEVVETESVMKDGGSSAPVEITLGASTVVLAVLSVVRKKMVF